MQTALALGNGLGLSRRGGSFPGIPTGFSASRDEGTTGDLYVAKTGSDSNPGTFNSPKLTISGALSAATAGQEIKVRAGTYREIVDFTGKGGSSGDRTTISRYGSEEVIISAAEPLTGFVACTIADEPDVGANWASIYKVTVPLTNFPGSDPRAAHPYENGVRLTAAVSWLPNPQYPDNEQAPQNWHTADATIRSGSLITGYQDASVTALYTQAQIENADVLFHYFPNAGTRTPVASFTSGTINLTDTTRTYESNQYKDRYALINLLPAMKRGQWGYKINGANATIYIWPNNPATINSAIEVSRRGKCVEATGVSHVEIRGLILERAASAGAATDGLYAYNAGTLTARDDHKIKNCLIRETYRARRDYAPIWLGLINNWMVEDTTVLNAYGQFGIFCEGGAWDAEGMADGGRLLTSVFDGVEHSPMRLFGQQNCLVAFPRARNSGLAAHSNKSNFYQDCHRVTFWGCDFRGSSGYLTWQRAGSVVVGFCDVPVSYEGADGRAIVDQNFTSAPNLSPATEQGISGVSFILNNMTEPFVDALAKINSLTLGKSGETQVTYSVKNNILHGSGNTTDTVTIDQALITTNGWRNNLLTSGSALAVAAGTDTTATVAAVYSDATKGDVSIKAGSPSRSAATISIATEVATLQGWYPDAADVFTKDLVGQTFNPATPPMGPYVNPDNAPRVSPLWIVRPSVVGTLALGFTLSLTDGYLIGTPWPSRTFQWVVSDDLDQWSDISGATSATYVIQSGDVGRYLGCRVTAGGVSTIAASSTLVLASYPLGTPVLLALDQETSGSFSSKNRETPAFATSGKPILVVASQRHSASSDATLTVTLGNAGRAFGTGTPVVFSNRQRRNEMEVQALLLLAPGTAIDQTVQVQSSLTNRGTQIAVFEIDGLTAIGATANVGGTTVTSIAPSVSTLNANSGVLHIVSRVAGDIAVNPITLTGCTELSNANTGGVDVFVDLIVAIGYEQASSVGVYGASAAWPTGRTVTCLSLELRS